MFISGDSGLSPFFWFKKEIGIKEIENWMLFSHARGALNYYLNRLKLEREQKECQILLPDYICDDLIRAVKATGFTVDYYKVIEDLKPSTEDIKKKITDRTLALLIVHYFGFFNPINDILHYCRGKGVPVIEDCAHVLFDSFTDRCNELNGDASIFSLRKQFPIPDGGLLFVKNMKINSDGLDRHRIKYPGLGKFFLKYILSQILTSPARSYGRENDIDDSFHDIKGISLFSEMILKNHVDVEFIKDRRRSNFFYYVNRLRESDINNKAEILYNDLKKSEAPYMFPLRLKRSNKEVIMSLRRQGIPAISWPCLPEEVRNSAWHGIAKEQQDRILLLPLHQDINESHIDFIIQKLYQFI